MQERRWRCVSSGALARRSAVQAKMHLAGIGFISPARREWSSLCRRHLRPQKHNDLAGFHGKRDVAQ